MSPTELTLRQLRAEGYTAKVVERWNPHAHIRQDVFGFDVLAAKPRHWDTAANGVVFPTNGILGVQTTSATHHADHKAKLLRNPQAANWIASGGRLAIWSWSTRRSEERTKAGKRSKRLVHHLRREEIRLSDFVPNQPAEQPREAVNVADVTSAADYIGDGAARSDEPF